MPKKVNKERCNQFIKVKQPNNVTTLVRCERSLGHTLFCGAWYKNEWVVANNQKEGEEG